MNPSVPALPLAPRASRWSSAATLVTLAAGLLVGIWLHDSGQAAPVWVAPIEALGSAFVRLLQMLVVPLLWCLVVCAVGTGRRAAGTAGARTFLVFVALLVLGTATSAVVSVPLVHWLPHYDLSGALDENVASAGSQARVTSGAAGERADPISWLVPDNPVAALVNGNITQNLVMALLVGIAIARLDERLRDSLLKLFQGGAEAMLWLLSRFLLAMPLAVFALAFQSARRSGADVAGVLGHLVIVISVPLLAFTLVMAPLGAWAARTSLRAYAAALLPVQALGLATRSSLASTPAVLESALLRLRLSPRAVEVAVPLCAAMFKPHGPTAHLAVLLYLTRAYDLPVGVLDVVSFVFLMSLLSFTMVGLPDAGGGPGRSLPAYLAIGVPAEAFFLSRSVDSLTDYPKTLVNVTGHLTAAALVARLEPPEPAVEAGPPTADSTAAA